MELRANKVLAVMVRYNTALADSQTVQGLARAFHAEPGLLQEFALLVWDNSPEALPAPVLPFPFEYRHTGENLGVSGAYNQALKHAAERKHTWMLLLDQDSGVTASFLRRMLAHAKALEKRAEVAAIAPVVKVGKVVMSPKRYLFNRTRPYRDEGSGILPGEATVINSGCLVRADALREIGGFNRNFWLDYADIYVFHQFFLRGKQVWRASDVELQHEMSIMDYDRLMTPWRYRNFSLAESAFHDLYKGHLENWSQNLRFLLRAVKQRFKYRNPEFSRIAWAALRYRLTTSRRKRLLDWRSGGGRVIPWAVTAKSAGEVS